MHFNLCWTKPQCVESKLIWNHTVSLLKADFYCVKLIVCHNGIRLLRVYNRRQNFLSLDFGNLWPWKSLTNLNIKKIWPVIARVSPLPFQMAVKPFHFHTSATLDHHMLLDERSFILLFIYFNMCETRQPCKAMG